VKLRLPGRRTLVTALVVVVSIAAATVVWHHLPTPPDTAGAFDVHGDAGERTAGRNVAATVTGVRVASLVNSIRPAGIWVVVDATLEAPRSTALPRSDLIVGPNTYTPTDVFFLDTLQSGVSPGINLRGSWVFDVATTLLEPGAADQLTLRVSAGYENRWDSRLVIRIPTSDVVRLDAVALEAPAASAS
jgi:hypothetical protein